MIVLLAFFAGFLVAAVPVGPLTLMYYRYAVLEDWRSAGLIGAVAGLSDVIYTTFAMLGYGWLLEAKPGVLLGVRIVGVLLVGGLGVRYAVAPPTVSRNADADLRGVAAQAVLVALFNPSALVTWVVAIDVIRTTFGLPPMGPAQQVLVPLSVGVGAVTWFWGLLLGWRSLGWAPRPEHAAAFVRIVGMVLIITAIGYAVRGL